MSETSADGRELFLNVNLNPCQERLMDVDIKNARLCDGSKRAEVRAQPARFGSSTAL